MSNLYKFPPANASTSYGGGGAEPDIALLKFFTKPSLNKTNFDYSTTAQSPTILNFDSNFMVATGDTSATDPGDYTITVSFKSKKYCRWDDGSTDDIVLPWTMDPIKHFTKPYLSATTFYANGSAQGPTLQNFDSTYMTRSGTLSATGDGGATYTVTVSFKDSATCHWSDNTFAPVELTWKIVDNRTYIEVTSDTYTVTCTKARNSEGTLTPTITSGNIYFKKSDCPTTIVIKSNDSRIGWAFGQWANNLELTANSNVTITADITSPNSLKPYFNIHAIVLDKTRYRCNDGSSDIIRHIVINYL